MMRPERSFFESRFESVKNEHFVSSIGIVAAVGGADGDQVSGGAKKVKPRQPLGRSNFWQWSRNKK